MIITAGASLGFGRGGGVANFFFRFGNLHVAKPERFARGVREHAPPRENFFKMVQFGAFINYSCTHMLGGFRGIC